MSAHLLLLVLGIGGFVALCAGQSRCQAALVGRMLAPVTARRLRWTGWALIAALGLSACAAFGAGRGLVLFAGYASLGAAVTVALTKRPH